MVVQAPRDIAIGFGWLWGRLSSAVSAQVLLEGEEVLELELTNAWQPLPRAEPGLSCARKLAAKQKGAVEVESAFVTQKVTLQPSLEAEWAPGLG